MLCGCVPVGTKHCGIPTGIGDTGFYVSYGDEKATAEAIKRALNNPDDLGRKARERIKEKFSPEKLESIKNGTAEGKEGDIIVFNALGLPGWIHAPSEPIVHRVIDKMYNNGWFFLTKGDANPTPDNGWVPETRIIGVVVGRIPYIGWVKILLTDSGLLIPLLVIVSALLIISIVWDIIKGDDEKGKNKSKDQLIIVEKANKYDEIDEIEIDFTKND